MSADQSRTSGETDGATPSPDRRSRTVVHLLPNDQSRGAQRYARALVDHLGSTETHLIMTLFESEGRVLAPDVSLDVPAGWLRRAGFDPRVVVRLRSAVRRLRVDLVVAHGGEPAKYASMALDRTTPLVYLNIGSTHPLLSRWHSKMLRDHFLQRSDAVVTVSRALADQTVSVDGLARDKIVVIPNGRDPVDYSLTRSGRSSQLLTLVWVGALDVTKRPELFIDLVRRLKEEGTSVRALIVGSGPRWAEISELAEKVGIEMLGERNDVPELLAESDILVFTGQPPEGMPGVLIEAGLSGLPTVSTEVPGADEVIEHGETGLLVDLDDAGALFDAVRVLLADGELRRRMGANARSRCVALFSFESTVDRWRELFSRFVRA